MNIADIVVLAVISIFAALAWKKGFIKACFSFVPMLLSFFASYKIYPEVSKFMRGTSMFVSFKNKIFHALNLKEIIAQKSLVTQTEIINNIRLPEFLKKSLVENNNLVVYDILDVNGIAEYISGFIANICINILSMILVFVIVFIVAKLILSALDLVSSLPVLNAFNKMGGLLVGTIQGIFVIWIVGIIITLFYYKPGFQNIATIIESSRVAGYFYENNLLLATILKIFT